MSIDFNGEELTELSIGIERQIKFLKGFIEEERNFHKKYPDDYWNIKNLEGDLKAAQTAADKLNALCESCHGFYGIK